MTRTIEVDCLVVGAGPAGTATAAGTASRGVRTLVIEKRAEIGVPVRCGEGISGSVLDMLDMPHDGPYMANKVDGARIFSPSGHEVVLGPEMAGPEVGYVIRRDVFDRELARKAVRSGSDLMVMCEALDMRRSDGYVKVRCVRLGEPIEVLARVVVAADGFESQVARWGGLDPTVGLRDIDTCLQYQMVDLDFDDRYCDFYLGSKVAPGGYVWCFPKGKGLFNVGIGVNGSMIDSPAAARRYLDSFIRSRKEFTKGRIVEINAGGVSVGLPMEKTVSDNLLVVGDAARMIDPLTGGGIYNACFAAQRAAETVAACVEAGSFTEADLLPYDAAWRKGIEEGILRNYIAKEKLLDIPDDLLDSVLLSISEFDMHGISTAELVRAVSVKHPELLRDLLP